MANPTRHPITCHVLDTTTGRPAPNIPVQLRSVTRPDVHFQSTTNTDGRITNWTLPSGDQTSEFVGGIMQGLIESVAATAEIPVLGCPVGSSLWKLQFDTGSYYGVENTFFPMVELTFLVKEGEHFHVPLLLGPYSFTTYRGS